MSKEMYISSSPHETKVAVLEDDQLVEVHFERDTDVGLVGGIYKGRVSRVLPGMQSAFVDIGLGRDAFLYVSDFFYEDQEEYDKVFEEAEARATKFTAQEGQAAAVVEAPSAPPLTEAPAAAVEAVAPPAEAPAAVTAPPAPPAGGSQSHERRPFDQRRGRRRRHRGRPGFGENRYADRKFTPPPPSPEPAGTFEILPGESLAKYGHTTPAATEESGPGLPEESSPQEIAGPGSAPLGGEGFSPAAPAEPLVEPEVAAQSPATLPGMFPDAACAQVAEPTVRFALGAFESVTAPPRAESVSTGVFEDATAAGIAHVEAPPEEPAPLAAPPLEPAIQIRQPQPAVEFAPPYAPVEEAEQPEAAEAAFHETMPDVTLEAEPYTSEPGLEAEEAGDFDLPEGAEEITEAAAEDAFPAPTTPEAENHEQPDTRGVAYGAPSIGEVPGSPDDRSYTLREPHQRPRLAPRRRRGRRGPGGPGGPAGPASPGGPRRPENRREPSRPGNNQPVQISEVLKEGQEILVQIAKEPLGTKGARITSHVALPGRYLVYMPTIDHIGVSRKIASEEERLRLRNVILENKGALTGGFIVRTAGQGRSEDEFKADLKFLSTLWSDIRSKSDRLKAPALIHRDLDLVQRLLRDLLTPDFKCVRVDSEIDYERVLDFVNRCQPALIGKIKLYTRDTPLFEEFGLQQELEKALKPKVWLKSGGYIVINQTEALVAVDVNTGKYVGKTNRLEDTILKTNVDAVNEIVRQVRLRDLGGIIVIDFIDMDERKNRAKVVQALEEALRSDRAPTKVISFHDFGLVAVTRKRVKQSLERTLCQPCTYCTGSGWIKSVNTVCNEILAEARKMAKEIDGNVITLRVSPEVAKALKSREGGLVSELESLTKKDVIIKSDPAVHQERFEIF
ncbi:MAG: Rne/Rng family ribonuclease [Terriglobia bacterium]|jgi:ribonuclease G